MPVFPINQFDVESDFALPCDAQAVSIGGEPLRVRRVSALLAADMSLPTATARTSEACMRFHRVTDGVLLNIEGRIFLKVDEGGQEIQVQARDEHLQEAALYIVGAAMALCTALRGDIPLHASCVELDDYRVGFMASCGTGKSTTLWEFLEAGALFANDDLIPVRLGERGATATSCISLFPKVGRDLMERDLRDWSGCEEILPGRNKFWFPIAPHRRAAASGPLTALFALQPFTLQEEQQLQYGIETVQIEAQRGVQALSLLAGNSMTGNILPSIVGAPRLMQNFARLAGAVPVYTVRYARRFETLPFVVEAVRHAVGLTTEDAEGTENRLLRGVN